ncbi:MAG: hypothetical protein ACK5WT_13375 [Betaproteobacteria bacterium]
MGAAVRPRRDGRAAAAVRHAGRPAVVTGGVGATAVAPAPQLGAEASAAQGRAPAHAP